MVCVSASVNLPLHHKVQKFSSGTGYPGRSRKRGRKTVVDLKWVRYVITLHTCSYAQMLPYVRHWLMRDEMYSWVFKTKITRSRNLAWYTLCPQKRARFNFKILSVLERRPPHLDYVVALPRKFHSLSSLERIRKICEVLFFLRRTDVLQYLKNNGIVYISYASMKHLGGVNALHGL